MQVIVPVLVLLHVLTFAAQSTPQPSATLASAQALLNAGKAEEARTMLRQLAAAEPANFRVWSTLGTVCRRLNDNDCAIAALQKALGIRPGDPQTLVVMGVAVAAKGDVDAAFGWFNQARATRRVDMTQLIGHPALTAIAKDPRFAALMPEPADFSDPFVEPTTIIKEFRGEAANDQFGWIARGIGDVDGDKAVDFVTSAPTSGAAGAGAGRIYVYSSKRGTLLWKADGAPGDTLGIGIEAAGDINGDGVGDVIASAPRGGYARVYDGKTGAVILTLKGTTANEAFGGHVAGLADVNGDKVPDLMVGAAGGPQAAADFSGRAYIFSGKDGALLLTLTGERGGDGFGAAVSGSMQQGRTLFVVGAPGAGPTRAGRAYIYRSLTDKPSFVVDADATGAALGAMFVGVPGDLDGDGAEDVYLSDFPNAAKGPSTGRVYVYSSRTGKALHTFTGENPGDALGTTQATAGDVDGDGTPDLAVGAWQYGGVVVSGGRVYLYSGRTGALLKSYTCKTPGDTFGFDAVGIGDVDADGTVDLLITSAWSAVNGFHSGRAFIISSGVAARRR